MLTLMTKDKQVSGAKIADSLTVSIDDLQLWDRNPRSIKGDRFNELKERLKRQGQIKPLLVAKDGTTVIGGNMRLRAMKELGIQEVWVSQTEATTDKDIFDLALTDNEEFGYYEQEQVAELALELGLSPIELKSYSLSLGAPTTLDLLVNKFAPDDEEEDDVPEVDEDNVESVLGEVYQLGTHRLMCGDATDADGVAELMDGNKAELVYTDPPYGIAYSSSKYDGNTKGLTNTRNKAEMIMGDADDFDPYFLLSMFKSAKELFVWGYQYYPEKLGRGGIIVWNKKRETEVDNPHGDFELCWSRNERNKMCWLRWGGFNNKEDGEDRLHTTQKPVALAEWFFSNWGKGLNNVVDLFGGSGSTLIACEQTNRICYMMELDPKYCDVIRKRYANHVGEGKNWQEVTPAVTAKELEHASR